MRNANPHGSDDEGDASPWNAEIDIAYRPADAGRGQGPSPFLLDLFFAERDRRKRVVVYVHGGHWMGGDKSEIRENPRLLEFLVRNDCVVASVNFRLVRMGKTRHVTYRDQTNDLAAALKWLTQNVQAYGGRPDGFILLGYSSGAHLAALLALDDRYLAGQGLDSSTVRSVIAMDVHAYDIHAALSLMEATPLKGNIPLMTSLFGESREEQDAASPATYAANPERKSFLLFSCGQSGGRPQTVSKTMSESFRERLAENGHEAIHEHLERRGHQSLLSQFGSGRDRVSEKIKVFLDIEAASSWGMRRGTREGDPLSGPEEQPRSRDLKLEAVRLAESTDRSVADIARELDVRVDELFAWRKEFKRHGKMSASLGKGKSGADPRAGDAPRDFPEAFKLEAVRLAMSSGRPVTQIARELAVPVNKLYEWKKRYAGKV